MTTAAIMYVIFELSSGVSGSGCVDVCCDWLGADSGWTDAWGSGVGADAGSATDASCVGSDAEVEAPSTQL